MSKDETIYLWHILESMDLLNRHLRDLSIDDFDKDETVREACLRTLHVMSESCTRLSKQTQNKAPEVEWIKIRGFRNVLVHDYLGDLDYGIIKSTVKERFPVLREAIERILKELGEM